MPQVNRPVRDIPPFAHTLPTLRPDAAGWLILPSPAPRLALVAAQERGGSKMFLAAYPGQATSRGPCSIVGILQKGIVEVTMDQDKRPPWLTRAAKPATDLRALNQALPSPDLSAPHLDYQYPQQTPSDAQLEIETARIQADLRFRAGVQAVRAQVRADGFLNTASNLELRALHEGWLWDVATAAAKVIGREAAKEHWSVNRRKSLWEGLFVAAAKAAQIEYFEPAVGSQLRESEEWRRCEAALLQSGTQTRQEDDRAIADGRADANRGDDRPVPEAPTLESSEPPVGALAQAGRAEGDIEPPPRKKRGRPTEIPDDLKLEALQVQGGKARAQILYKTRYPSSQQVKNVSTILRHFERTRRKSE